MICEFYQNTAQKSIEDGYIKANIGRCVHCEFTKAERLSRLKEGDILVVANAATLSMDPVNLLWTVNHLSHLGVQIHFVEENVVIRGNACDQTSHVVEKILSLLGDSTSSHSCGLTPLPAASVHGGTQGRVECDPIGWDMVWDAKAASERERILKGKTPIHPTAREHSSQGRKIKFTKKDQSYA